MTTAYQRMIYDQAQAKLRREGTLPMVEVLPAIGRKGDLTGEEIALTGEDLVEVDGRLRSMREELRPRGSLEDYFVRRVVTMTVRVERGVRQETSSLSYQVRRAEADYENARIDEADRLYVWITADPAAHVRKLRQTPEGVDRMLQAWQGLKDDLLHPSRVRWDWVHLEKVENLMSRRLSDIPISRAKALSDAMDGDFKYLEADDAVGIDDQARRDWAREQLAELIDSKIDRLDQIRGTFDEEDFKRARTEAVDRVLFDPSKEATLARKYEAAAERSLYRALRELRELQARPIAPEPDPEPEPDDLTSLFPEDERPEVEPRQPEPRPALPHPSSSRGRSKSSKKAAGYRVT